MSKLKTIELQFREETEVAEEVSAEIKKEAQHCSTELPARKRPKKTYLPDRSKHE